MDAKFIEELRQKYIRNLPEGRTAKPVKNMTDSDFPDMCYFPIVLMVLTMMNLKKGFTSTFSGIVCFLCPHLCGLFY